MSEKPALQPGLAVGEALRAVARDILGEARAAVEDPAHSDAVAVHEFRRAMKRWRALLRLLEPFLEDDGRRLRIEARDLARSLGGAETAVERWPLHVLTFPDVADRLVLGFREGRRALPRSWTECDPEDLH